MPHHQSSQVAAVQAAPGPVAVVSLFLLTFLLLARPVLAAEGRGTGLPRVVTPGCIVALCSGAHPASGDSPLCPRGLAACLAFPPRPRATAVMGVRG